MKKMKYILTGMLSDRLPGRLTGEEYGGSIRIIATLLRINMTKFKYILTVMLSGRLPGRLTGE